MPSGRAVADVPLVWRPGDVILGLYEVIAVAGTGGMGVVYRVRHRDWQMDLAVKVPQPGNDPPGHQARDRDVYGRRHRRHHRASFRG
jgi:hypothetical protein